jgi:bifunctional ADP-heptose synthase (sugar kinase/adenylyltransferase)
MRNLPQLLRRLRRLRILVVGDVMLDHYIWGDATRISPEAPVPVIDIARDSWTAGGAANVALNLASLGARCTVVGRFGNDESGRRLAECDAVILSDYAKGILNNTVLRELTRLARSAGKLIALDPKPRRGLAFEGLDLITPNKREALQLAGLEPSPHTPFPAAEVCARLHERHATRHLVVTLGEEGMLLSTGGKVRKVIPTAAREVFDVSGAGDTALAGLVLALAAGSSLEQAAHFANAAAGVVVGKLGTATVTPGELTAYVGRR